MRISLLFFLCLLSVYSFSQKNPVVMNHQFCNTARVVCNITDQPSEGSLCNSSCSGNNNLVNASNSCFTGGLTRWGFYIFTVRQSGTLTFVINPNPPGFFDYGNYNFALFDVTNGCGSLGNAIRCSIADNPSNPAQNTGLDMSSTDTTEGTSGDGWVKYINAQCGHTYLLCMDIPQNDGNGFSLSFGGSCLFGVPVGFTATPDTVCAGQPVNFSLSVCNIPNAWISYQWNFGPNATPATFTGSTPPPVTFSTTGIQNITLTGTTSAGNGCSNSASQTVFVTAGAPTSLFSVSTPVCLGTNATVTYSGNASASATYTWNFGSGTVVSGSGQGPYQVSWATPGTYTISLNVTECATPSGVTTNTVTVFASPTANAGADVSICAGSSASLTGTGGIFYGWLPASGLSCTNCPNPIASPTATTTYTMAVMDANGCTNTDMIIVTVKPLPSANAGPDASICAGQSYSLNASGGTNYLWNPSVFLSNPNIANPVANPTSSITYTVTVTGANGCSNSDAINITVNPLPAANAGADVTICNGTIATLNASGGTSYLWSPSIALNNPNISNPTATATATTTYTVTVTGVNGCSNTDAVVVTVNPLPVVNAGADVSICFGFNTTLNASGGISYVWNPSVSLSNPNISNPVATASSTTNYTVTVTGANGCSNTDNVSVTVNPTPAATVSSANVLCFGGNSGNATANVSVGTSPFTYLWNSSPAQTTQTATGLPAGNYSVLITDANGCTATKTVSITQPSALTVSISLTNVSCFGGNNGTASVAASGGTPSYTYIWNPGGQTTSAVTGLSAQNYYAVLTDANGCQKTVTVTITQPTAVTATVSSVNAGCGMSNGSATATAAGGSPAYTYSWSNGSTTSSVLALAVGNYTVTVTDANGCTFTNTVTVNQNPPPNAQITGNFAVCLGQSVQLTASGGNSFSWSNGSTSAQITVSPAAATSYSVIAANNACYDTASVTVVVNPLPIANAGTDVTITYGSGTQLSGSGSGLSYNWVPSNSLSCSNCQNPIASPPSTTNYIVYVTDANGCVNTDTVNVFVDITCKDIYLPNAFSPNGDGDNDELRIFTWNISCITDFKIIIFDRWGEKVFESTDPNFRWDGKYTRGLFSGEEGSAVFIYFLKAEMLNGESINRKGNVSLIR